MLGMTKKVALSALATLMMLFGSLALAGSASAAPTYPAGAATSVTIDFSDAVVRRGQPLSITVTVTSGAGTPQGTLTVQVVGVRSFTKVLVNGTATQALPTDLRPGTYKVVATYNGTTGGAARVAPRIVTEAAPAAAIAQAAPEAGFQPASATGFYTIQGANAGAGDDAGDNRPGLGGVVDGDGGLGATGSSADTELLGLVGLGLVAAGAVSLVLYRRRSNA